MFPLQSSFPLVKDAVDLSISLIFFLAQMGTIVVSAKMTAETRDFDTRMRVIASLLPAV